MNDDEKTASAAIVSEGFKTCPHCAETVRCAAKVCPRCRYAQRYWSLYNPEVKVILLTVFAIGVCLFCGTLLSPKRDFAPYRNDIVVLSSSMVATDWDTNRYMTVVGLFTNKTDFSWKTLELEVQFFDAAGQLIDSQSACRNWTTILPHAEQAFRISVETARPRDQYATHKVFVRSARDFRELFP